MKVLCPSTYPRRSLTDTDKWAQCILWDLPHGYRLYEHIKSKADGQTKPVKNHSGGGHDRQDAYLYGYPKGPKKRFRSPVEFFPHLLWLSTDESREVVRPDNVVCFHLVVRTGDTREAGRSWSVLVLVLGWVHGSGVPPAVQRNLALPRHAWFRLGFSRCQKSRLRV